MTPRRNRHDHCPSKPLPLPFRRRAHTRQRVIFIVSLWFTSNYISGTLIWPSTMLHPNQMHHMDLFGFIPVMINGWHLIFHLATGLAGLALVRRRRSAVGYAFTAAGLYLLVAGLGFIGGTTTAGFMVGGLIMVDPFGNWVHGFEGTTLLVTALFAVLADHLRSPEVVATVSTDA